MQAEHRLHIIIYEESVYIYAFHQGFRKFMHQRPRVLCAISLFMVGGLIEFYGRDKAHLHSEIRDLHSNIMSIIIILDS